MTCRILELDPPHRLVHSHLDPAATLTWELRPEEGGRCRLTLVQTTEDIGGALSGQHPVGLHHSLDRLGPSLAGQPVPWDWDRFAQLQESYAPALAAAAGAPRRAVIEEYFEGFRRGDHERILACLTDDVTWDIVGHTLVQGKADFDGQIDGPDGTGLPRLSIETWIEEGDTLVVLGQGAVGHGTDGGFAFRFADAFTFEGELIARLDSYVVPVPGP